MRGNLNKRLRKPGGWCKAGHMLFGDNVRVNAQGAFVCAECMRESSRKAYAKKAELRARVARLMQPDGH